MNLAMYKIVIEEPAISDLKGLRDYIAKTLKEPVSARRIYFSIKEKIKTLDQFPFRNQLVNDEILAAQGIRILHAENYLVFYVANEASKRVNVLRILYKRREWQSLLSASVSE